MNQVNWVPIVATLLGGGACGAIITAVVTALRNRRQPIGFRMDVLPIFEGTLSDSALPARLTILDPAGKVELDNLFVAEVQLINRGNKDWSTIAIGLTLPSGQRAVHVSAETPDRHHSCVFSGPPTPNLPSPTIDFSFEPFNRGDSYIVRAYTIAPPGLRPSPPEIGSREPVRFRPMPTLTELAARAASSFTIELAGIQLSIPRRQ